MYWYVLFVKTGYEQKVANEITGIWELDDLKPFVPTYEARFKRGGIIYPEKRQLFPGYVFIEAELNGIDFYKAVRKRIIKSENILKILSYDDDRDGCSFEMKRDEYIAFLKLYNDDYCIEMSKGFIDGDLVHITEGPLKGYDSKIKKVRASKMEAVVELEIMGKMIDIKVGLEIIKKI